MAFFIRVAGASTPDQYMAAKKMVYMNDHNWRDALVTQQADDVQLRDNEFTGMYLRLYLSPFTANATQLVLFSHLDGHGKYATPRIDSQYPVMDSPVFSPVVNLFAILTVDLIDTYGQEYYFAYFGVMPGQPIQYYLTLDYSLIMGRQVLKVMPTINTPLSGFTLSYTKGTGPLMYGIPYYIRTRQPTDTQSGSHKLKSTPDGKLIQVPDTDLSAPTRFFFFKVANAPSTVYSIRSDFGQYVCLTDTGTIEPRSVVGPWEQFEIARDWWVPGRFVITRRYNNDPFKVFGLRFSKIDASVTTWRVGVEPQADTDSFEIHPISPGLF